MNFLKLISITWEKIADYERFLFGQGSWTLLPHEQIVLDAGLTLLSEQDKNSVSRQLEQQFFFDRMTEGRINVFRFYDANPSLKLSDPDFLDKSIRVNIKVDGRKLKSNVTFYKGYIWSVEFTKPKGFFQGKPVAILSVEEGKPGSSFTQVIDRYEHGREPEN